ncbi:hypothetical protein [Actinomadura sp. HBU206391]|uniref:hypothetical protein n=1 Tax=Actinomadura sp. HBU206391 TaxID=2731692 RepID=UPI00164FF1EA|nr:hypothetical protein [Actinomadura sp. HBU206391]MBC6461547.1 hypothetical protein [Actinomadura sp. HBU206391]
MNVAGQHITALSILLFAVGAFFLTGVVVFVRQGIKSLAVVALIVAALALTAGVLRL